MQQLLLKRNCLCADLTWGGCVTHVRHLPSNEELEFEHCYIAPIWKSGYLSIVCAKGEPTSPVSYGPRSSFKGNNHHRLYKEGANP